MIPSCTKVIASTATIRRAPEQIQSFWLLYCGVFLQIFGLYLEFSGYCDIAAGMARRPRPVTTSRCITRAGFMTKLPMTSEETNSIVRLIVVSSSSFRSAPAE